MSSLVVARLIRGRVVSPLMGEALRRGQAPWLRPAKVEQFRDGVWRPSASALKALDKRIAYPPPAGPRSWMTGPVPLAGCA
ncbi:hypothetical protein [Deinococcus multiflagellatus]|uniref:Uncharacterized protein n=1 Tax=Deinococcus multiflagellatus TaxID=1656887 RepID=A0ABW1ZS15_9DEIO